MKIAQYVAAFLSALFIGIVLIERVPGVLVDTSVAHEWLMFGLFKISLIDDVTHALSGIAGVIALIAGPRWTVKYIMTIGGYYALDALFTVVYGVLIGQGVVQNILLNGPHIGITVLVIIALHYSVKRIALSNE
jgi:hypothetical protein